MYKYQKRNSDSSALTDDFTPLLEIEDTFVIAWNGSAQLHLFYVDDEGNASEEDMCTDSSLKGMDEDDLQEAAIQWWREALEERENIIYLEEDELREKAAEAAMDYFTSNPEELKDLLFQGYDGTKHFCIYDVLDLVNEDATDVYRLWIDSEDFAEENDIIFL